MKVKVLLDLPEVGGAVPHHLVLLQCQPLNHSLAVVHKLAAEGFLNGLHNTYEIERGEKSPKS